MLYAISIFVIMGVFLSAEMLKQKNNGLGIYYVTRCSYVTYLKNFCGAIVLYLSSIIVISMCLLLIIAYFVGGFSIGVYTIGLYKLTLGEQLLAGTCHIALLIVYASAAMLISAMISMYFNNLFFARIFPAAVFVIMPQVLGGTLANVFSDIGTVLCRFIPVRIVSNVQSLLSTVDSDAEIITETSIALLLLGIILAGVYMKSISRFSKDYL